MVLKRVLANIGVISLLFFSHAGVAGAQTRDVLAVVNSAPITMADVDAKLGASLAKLNDQIYNLRKAQLDSLIDEELLKREAATRGVTSAALVEAEINSKIQPATTADASAFYEANKAKLQGGEFPAVEDQIKTYLTSQRLTARRKEFVASLRDKATINVFLEPPAPFRADVPIDNAYVRGKAGAPVTIVEFSDFHCPFCRKAYPIVQQLLAKYGDKVRLVYKDMPLDNLHPNARAAAEAAQCAGSQGKFWEFHDILFTAEPDVTPATLNKQAKDVGLDVKAFESCYTSRKFKARVEASAQDGSRLGVTGTPTFFINGRNVVGAQPLEAFARVVDEELKNSTASASNK